MSSKLNYEIRECDGNAWLAKATSRINTGKKMELCGAIMILAVIVWLFISPLFYKKNSIEFYELIIGFIGFYLFIGGMNLKDQYRGFAGSMVYAYKESCNSISVVPMDLYNTPFRIVYAVQRLMSPDGSLKYSLTATTYVKMFIVKKPNGKIQEVKNILYDQYIDEIIERQGSIAEDNYEGDEL